MRISDWSSDVCSSDLKPDSILYLAQLSIDGLHQIAPKGKNYPMKSKDDGTVEKTRTSTAFRPQRPQRFASTSSATTAHHDGPDRVRHQAGAGASHRFWRDARELSRFYFCPCERARPRGGLPVLDPTPTPP